MDAGGVAKTAEEAYAAAKSLNSNNMVLKAQVAFPHFDLSPGSDSLLGSGAPFRPMFLAQREG